MILLAELVDLLSEVTQPAPLPTKRELASLRLLFAEPETGPYAFVAELLALPAAERAMTVTALLAGNARALERVGLAGQLLLTPLDAATHACVRQLPV